MRVWRWRAQRCARAASETLAVTTAAIADRFASLHRLALDEASAVEQTVRAGLAAPATATESAIDAEDLYGYRDLLDACGSLDAPLGNPLFVEAERSARGRAKLHAAADGVDINWIAVRESAAALTEF